MINVEVTARKNEPNASVLRRFSQRVRSSNLLRTARSHRYHTRSKSKYMRKLDALNSIKRVEEIEFMRKLGKLPERRSRR